MQLTNPGFQPFPGGPGRDGRVDVQTGEVPRQQPLVEGRDRHRADADLEAVGQAPGGDVHTVSLHLPQMAELVLRPGSGAARLVGLHGQPAHQEPLHQLTRRRDVTDGEFCRPRDSTAQRTLDEFPHPLIDGLDPQHVGEDPVGPGRDLAQQVAVAGCRHHLRCGGHHGQVGDAATRGRAAQRLLEPVQGDRGTESGVAVHGGRRTDHHVGSAEFPGGPFRDVVERAGANGHGDRIHRCQGIPQGLAVLVFRV